MDVCEPLTLQSGESLAAQGLELGGHATAGGSGTEICCGLRRPYQAYK